MSLIALDIEQMRINKNLTFFSVRQSFLKGEVVVIQNYHIGRGRYHLTKYIF